MFILLFHVILHSRWQEALYNYMPNFVCVYFSMKRVSNFIQTFKGIHDPHTTISGMRIKSRTEQSEILALPQIPPEVLPVSDSRFPHMKQVLTNPGLVEH